MKQARHPRNERLKRMILAGFTIGVVLGLCLLGVYLWV